MSAETPETFVVETLACDASMGPRSRERGNVAKSGCNLLELDASMGPRSRERGNGGESSAVAGPAEGFNGAALT